MAHEERRKDRKEMTVSVTAFLGFVDLLSTVVRENVASPAERSAIGKAFDVAIRRAGLADLVHDVESDLVVD